MAGQAVSLYGSVGKPPQIPGYMSRLGGGMNGFIPQAYGTVNNNHDFAKTRFFLRDAWNNNYMSYPNAQSFNCTPFRRVYNAGDLYTRKYYSCGGPCQTFQSRPNLHGLKGKFGSIMSNCDATGVAPASCNVKFVYEHSDYVRYLKQKAIVKNYNDLTYGGDDHFAGQSIIKAIRRY